MKKKILIVGDSARGKSTLAKKLSEKTGIPFYSTDDFYWKIKFTEAYPREESFKNILPVYDKPEWIVEGSSRHLIQPGLEKADIIYLLKFKNIITQYYFIIKRHFSREDESLLNVWRLLKHVTFVKYKPGYGDHMPKLSEMLEPYTNKVVKLTSLREIHQVLNAKP